MIILQLTTISPCRTYIACGIIGGVWPDGATVAVVPLQTMPADVGCGLLGPLGAVVPGLALAPRGVARAQAVALSVVIVVCRGPRPRTKNTEIT